MTHVIIYGACIHYAPDRFNIQLRVIATTGKYEAPLTC
jgi:ferredoxin